jgi:hypothetical protein
MKKNKTAGTFIETVIAVAIVALLMVTAVVNIKNPYNYSDWKWHFESSPPDGWQIVDHDTVREEFGVHDTRTIRCDIDAGIIPAGYRMTPKIIHDVPEYGKPYMQLTEVASGVRRSFELHVH